MAREEYHEQINGDLRSDNTEQEVTEECVPAKAEAPKQPDFELFVFGTEEDGLRVSEVCEYALQQVCGSRSDAVNEGLFNQGLRTLTRNEVADGPSDMRGCIPAIVRDIVPRDGVERMLTVQMAVTHVALIRQGGRLARVDQLPQFDAHECAFNKLARTFAAQVEALRKHRNGGKRTVTVQHVNVEDDGQAIVGNVETRGGNSEQGQRPVARGQRTAEVHCTLKAVRRAMQGSRRNRLECLPDARRWRGA